MTMKPISVGCLLFGFLLANPISLFAQPYAISSLVGSSTNAGSADGTNGAAQLLAPTGLASSTSGDLLVTDGHALRRITTYGANLAVQTLAGSVRQHAFLDGTNAAARFNAPQGVAADGAGNFYVADTYNNAIRKVSRVGTDWVVTTLAGPTPSTVTSGAIDGTNNTTRFNKPYGIALDSATNLYVADTLNHTIRKISPVGTNWVVTTLAGSAGTPGSANGTNGAALFNSPTGVAVDAAGNLYVADFANNMVRKLTPVGTNWAVTTLAGTLAAGINDGPSGVASFNAPQCLALDSAGNLFVADSGNYTIRKISPAGIVSTLAGSPGVSGNADGIGDRAQFAQPCGVVISPAGSLFVADYLGYSIRQGRVAPLLHIALADQNVIVSWPAALTGCVLQTCSTQPPTVWQDHTNGVTVSGDSFRLTDSLLPGGTLYRLRPVGP
jgi:hypothetical protein